MTGKRKGYTKKAERMRLYLEQIAKLRTGQICMNNDIMVEAVQTLISLNRRFEREDNPKCL